MRRIVAMLGLLVVTTACGVGASPPKASLVESHAGVTTTVARTATSAAKAKAVVPPHIFVIVLENEQYSLSYQHNPNPWLGKKLQKEGTLLTKYYGTGHFSNDNYISMISGQAPNADTSADCQQYPNFNNTTKKATLNKSGQAVGTGCVFPSNVKTLANQLTTHHVTWHGYMEDMGNTAAREQKTCGVPTLVDGNDDTQVATPADQYAARHNPFVYFRSLVDSGLCKKNVVPLTALTKALKKTSTTPDFSFITPDLCDDGHDTNCQGPDTLGSHAGGLVSIDHFLSVWVPRIQKSPAYKKNGEIIITTDEANLNDDTSCCGEKGGPTDPNPPGLSGPGGGRIGTLVIGKCVKAGATDAKPYNHYSLLRSLENIYRIKTGGSDGKGHLGYAGMKGLHPFGKDLFSRCTP